MVLEPRGVMEPYREPRGRAGLITLLAGALVFAGFGAVVGYAYFNGLPSFGGEPPVIRADTTPYRRAPDDRGGLEVANASSSIVNVLRPEAEPPRVERLLPPEPPLTDAVPAPAASPPAPPPPPAPAAATPAPPPAAVSAPPAPAPAAAPAPPLAPLPTAKPPQLAAAVPAAAPAAPRPEPERSPPQRQARVEPTAPAPAAPQRTLTPEPPAAAGLGRAGEIYRLQLAAVRTDGGLTQAWAQLKQRYPGPLGPVSPRIERTETTSGPLFRLQAGPFASREAASDACGSIRAGGGQCFIVGPVAP